MTEGRMTSLSLEHRDRIRRGQPLPDAPEIGAAAAEAEEILRRVALPSPPPETTPYLATTTEIVQHHLCPRRYHLRYRIGAPAVELSRRGDLHDEGDSQEVKDDEVPAEVLGDRVHRILAEEPGSPLIDDLLSTLSPRDRNDAERQIRTLRESRFAREAAEGRALREVPFALARSGTTLRGQIDLVVERRDGGLLVVDYKTSRIGAGEVEEKAADYELQLRIYALAVKETFGRLPAGAFLYFLHPDIIREVDLSVPWLERAEKAIAAYFDAHRAGEYPQRPARHCLSCGYRQAYCPNLSPGDLVRAGSLIS